MNLQTIVGIMASIGTTVSLIPQLIKILKTKNANEISLVMLGILFIGVCLWVWYGFLKDDMIIIISNSFALFVNILTVIFILKYKTTSGK